MKKIRNPVARCAWQRGGVHGKSKKAERRQTRVETLKLVARAVTGRHEKPGSGRVFLCLSGRRGKDRAVAPRSGAYCITTQSMVTRR